MQTSETVVAGATPDIVRASDHNEIVADLAELYAAVGVGALTFTDPPDMILDYWYKANAFTFGTAPFTSQGYLRLPNGAPWGADGISGTPYDQAANTGTTTTLTETVCLNVPVLLPAHGALTVTKVEIAIRHGVEDNRGDTNVATITKVGIEPIVIAADGTESSLGAEVFTALTSRVSKSGGATEPNIYDDLISADFGAGYSVLATERLGFRIRHYTTGAAAMTISVYWPLDYNDTISLGIRRTQFAIWLA